MFVHAFFAWLTKLSQTWFLSCARDYYCGVLKAENTTIPWCNDIEYDQDAEVQAVNACEADPMVC